MESNIEAKNGRYNYYFGGSAGKIIRTSVTVAPLINKGRFTSSIAMVMCLQEEKRMPTRPNIAITSATLIPTEILGPFGSHKLLHLLFIPTGSVQSRRRETGNSNPNRTRKCSLIR